MDGRLRAPPLPAILQSTLMNGRVEARQQVKEETMRNHLGWIVVMIAMLTLGAPVTGAQSTQETGDTFTWVGELVSVDATARTVTVKSRVAYQEALAELKQFKAGERVWVVWSGVSNHSDAVRQFRRPEANGKITDTLMMPAELVSPEVTNQYVTLRVKVPEAGVTAIKGVKPGEWITVTSRQRPVTDTDAVVAVKPYSQSSTAPTTTTN
jgi:hypothetical protein